MNSPATWDAAMEAAISWCRGGVLDSRTGKTRDFTLLELEEKFRSLIGKCPEPHWVCVPAEATAAMINAGNSNKAQNGYVAGIYRAMIAASAEQNAAQAAPKADNAGSEHGALAETPALQGAPASSALLPGLRRAMEMWNARTYRVDAAASFTDELRAEIARLEAEGK